MLTKTRYRRRSKGIERRSDSFEVRYRRSFRRQCCLYVWLRGQLA